MQSYAKYLNFMCFNYANISKHDHLLRSVGHYYRGLDRKREYQITYDKWTEHCSGCIHELTNKYKSKHCFSFFVTFNNAFFLFGVRKGERLCELIRILSKF